MDLRAKLADHLSAITRRLTAAELVRVIELIEGVRLPDEPPPPKRAPVTVDDVVSTIRRSPNGLRAGEVKSALRLTRWQYRALIDKAVAAKRVKLRGKRATARYVAV